jgi:hypothetical protein
MCSSAKGVERGLFLFELFIGAVSGFVTQMRDQSKVRELAKLGRICAAMDGSAVPKNHTTSWAQYMSLNTAFINIKLFMFWAQFEPVGLVIDTEEGLELGMVYMAAFVHGESCIARVYIIGGNPALHGKFIGVQVRLISMVPSSIARPAAIGDFGWQTQTYTVK